MKTNIQDTLSVADRLTGPTPKFFKTIRTIGIVVATLSGALMSMQAQGVELPAFVAVVANGATVIAGVVATLVSSLTVDVTEYEIRNALK